MRVWVPRARVWLRVRVQVRTWEILEKDDVLHEAGHQVR